MFLTVSLLKGLCSLLRWRVTVLQSSNTAFALFLEKHQITLIDCRGQAHDNASNRRGKYSGLQARIRKKNPPANYIACAHSLNLVGHSAVDNMSAASKLFELVRTSTALSASTHRWELLVNALGGLPVVKCLSDGLPTPMLQRHNCGYEKNQDGFREIYRKPERNSQSTTRGKGYLSKLKTLANCILLMFWSVVMANMDLNEAVKLLRSLINYVASLRHSFETLRRKGRLKLALKMSLCTTKIPKERNKDT